MLSGHFGVVLVYLSGLKDFEDRQGGPVRSRATISADFERKVPIFPCFRLDASDQFSYHLATPGLDTLFKVSTYYFDC